MLDLNKKENVAKVDAMITQESKEAQIQWWNNFLERMTKDKARVKKDSAYYMNKYND